MSIQITNEGATLGITADNQKKYIQKGDIRIQIIGNVLRITDAQKTNYDLLYADVTLPVSANITDLASQIETFLETGGAPLAAGAATEVKQDAGNISLASIKTNTDTAARTPGFINSSTSGTVTAGAKEVSIANTGSAAGTVLGTSLPAGVVITYNTQGKDTLGVIAFNATGTTFLISEIR